MSRRKKQSSQSPPPIAPQPIHPMRRLLRRLLFLLAVFVIVAGPILVARLRNHDAKARIVNQAMQPVTDVELTWEGGNETWAEIAPGSSAELVIPESALRSLQLRFVGPDGGRNRLFHSGQPLGTMDRVFLSRRIDFMIRNDPLRPDTLSATILRPRDVNFRELVGLDD